MQLNKKRRMPDVAWYEVVWLNKLQQWEIKTIIGPGEGQSANSLGGWHGRNMAEFYLLERPLFSCRPPLMLTLLLVFLDLWAAKGVGTVVGGLVKSVGVIFRQDKLIR